MMDDLSFNDLIEHETQDIRDRIPEVMPILPLRDTVVFPNIVTPLVVAREKSVKLINDVISGSRMLGLVAQKTAEVEDPKPDDIYHCGTAAIILRMLKFPDGSHRVLVQGLSRIRIARVESTSPYYTARIEMLAEKKNKTTELEALKRNVAIQFQKIVSHVPQLPDELQVVVVNTEDAGKLADLVASNLNLSLEEKQGILEEINVRSRLKKLT